MLRATSPLNFVRVTLPAGHTRILRRNRRLRGLGKICYQAAFSGLILSSQKGHDVGHFGVSEGLPSYCFRVLSLSDA